MYFSSYLPMTEKDLHTKSVMDKLLSHTLTQQEASLLLGKSLRQTQRIEKRYKEFSAL
jgi:hypothetical protein